MARVISTLPRLLLAVVAGPANACEGMSREATSSTVARVEIVRVAVSSTPISETVCALASRTSRPGGARGVSRPTSPPLPPPGSTFRI